MADFKSANVKELVAYMSRPQNAQFRADLESSFQKALESGIPQFKEWDITSFKKYLHFMDDFLTWVPTETRDGTHVYYHLCMFYFVLDQDPVSKYQTTIAPHGPWTWLSQWVVNYAQTIGRFMDSEQSINAETLQTFKDSPPFRIKDYIEPFGGWKTFNQFFARKILPGLRPIADPNSNATIVSSADSKFDGWWPVDEDAVASFKGVPWSISQLLADSLHGEKFTGGLFCHSFLTPTDYHRQHSPINGTIVEAKVIPGNCYLEVVVENNTRGKPKLVMRRRLSPGLNVMDRAEVPDFAAPDSPGYQFLQARALILIHGRGVGYVAVLPIGMAQVSSVVLSVKEGDVVQKGQEISYFQFGGSDLVMVFQKDALVTFTAEEGTHYNVGTEVATSAVIDEDN